MHVLYIFSVAVLKANILSPQSPELHYKMIIKTCGVLARDASMQRTKMVVLSHYSSFILFMPRIHKLQLQLSVLKEILEQVVWIAVDELPTHA